VVISLVSFRKENDRINLLLKLPAEGSGRSKKLAKQSAAEAFIFSLIYKVMETSPTNPESSTKKIVNFDTLIGQGNFIGGLQEFCRRWNMPNPTYRLDMELGLPHAKQYFITCALHDRRTFGSASKKKIAKQLAAEEMWAEVQNDMG
jgi:RISC-loading complex subunit TARBP2